jgi:hypothetical protein
VDCGFYDAESRKKRRESHIGGWHERAEATKKDAITTKSIIDQTGCQDTGSVHPSSDSFRRPGHRPDLSETDPPSGQTGTEKEESAESA